ncbi:hypothetical protein GGTG_03288 [Gaeumannomyces tritici R3-111a-1]|uniref:MAS3 protein n=1 Tax=Gaeumannomyces tritici (strain R3-111a-1) TaxID=644352 RepID=J3NPT1_GAET3|nr:hypothetical protein GGTG_03288 [Gaeumannomyces tritici R3-111a-1]EJT78186.1 hypothetical protein GGTG_03288 [Gaeumannomyces tritici R3-111a-1]
MFAKAILLALAASPLVAAHGKPVVIKGDLGGNGTALANQGGIIPGEGPNRKTEPDTTVFKKVNGKVVFQSDGMGRTQGQGQNKMNMIKAAMALSGNTLPQVSSTGGTIEGTYHIVTDDGAGPIQACIDPTATGTFTNCTMLKVVTQVPGNGGRIKAPAKNGKRDGPVAELWDRALEALHVRGIIKRAAKNVNQDFPMKFEVPAGTTCQGTVEGINNVCLVKIANPNRAGPFGGVMPIQIQPGAGSGNATAPAAPAKAASAKAVPKGNKRSVEFTA